MGRSNDKNNNNYNNNKVIKPDTNVAEEILQEAYMHLCRAIESDPTFANPVRHMGDYYRVYRKNFEKSLECYQKALKLKEEYSEAMIGMEIIRKIKSGEMPSEMDHIELQREMSEEMERKKKKNNWTQNEK